MEEFLSSVERRALHMARMAVGNTEDALDIVQDAMLTLVQKYARRDSGEWKPLFYRILQSRILDWHRRQKVRRRWLGWLPGQTDPDADEEDRVQAQPDPGAADPLQQMLDRDAIQVLEKALQDLPLRQQQAFLLRNWEGLSVADTAKAMQCSEGSVKTHLSRALQSLRSQLEDHWP